MAIADEISRLQSAKAALAVSIENKGVTVPSSTKLDGYSALVDQIQQGGEGGTVIIYGGQAADKGVSFTDCDGSIVASYTKDEIENLESLPAAPAAKTGLEFAGWSKTLAEIKAEPYEDWICAKYTLEDDNTLYAVIITPEDNCTFTFDGLKAWNVTEGNYTIDWGDGSATTTSNVTKSHVYSSAGAYIAKVSISTGYTFTVSFNLVTPKSSQYLVAAYIPANFDFNSCETYYTNPTLDSCHGAVFNTRPDGYVIVDDRNNSSNIGVGVFANCRIFWLNTENMGAVSGAGAFAESSIRAISSVTQVNRKMFYNCKDIKKVIVRSTGGGYVGEYAFYNAARLNYFSAAAVTSGSSANSDNYAFATTSQDSLEEVWFSVASNGFPAEMFVNRTGVKVYFPKFSPPTLSGVSDLGGVVIYVPTSALSSYQAADNWSVLYAHNQIIGYNF